MRSTHLATTAPKPPSPQPSPGGRGSKSGAAACGRSDSRRNLPDMAEIEATVIARKPQGSIRKSPSPQPSPGGRGSKSRAAVCGRSDSRCNRPHLTEIEVKVVARKARGAERKPPSPQPSPGGRGSKSGAVAQPVTDRARNCSPLPEGEGLGVRGKAGRWESVGSSEHTDLAKAAVSAVTKTTRGSARKPPSPQPSPGGRGSKSGAVARAVTDRARNCSPLPEGEGLGVRGEAGRWESVSSSERTDLAKAAVSAVTKTTRGPARKPPSPQPSPGGRGSKSGAVARAVTDRARNCSPLPEGEGLGVRGEAGRWESVSSSERTDLAKAAVSAVTKTTRGPARKPPSPQPSPGVRGSKSGAVAHAVTDRPPNRSPLPEGEGLGVRGKAGRWESVGSHGTVWPRRIKRSQVTSTYPPRRTANE